MSQSFGDVKEKITVDNIEYAEKHIASTAKAGEVELVNDHGETRRIPIPSDDPNDPLNFKPWRKYTIMASCCWFSVFSLVLVGGLGPVLPVLFGVYLPQGHAAQDVVNLTTYPSMVMVLGCFVILPLSMMFGRRPVFLGCCIVLIASTVGAGVSQTLEAHMGCRVVQGLATGATESLLPLIITDITFISERGLYYGIYWGIQNIINAAFLIFSSYLVVATSWRWFYWLILILVCIGTVLGFFFLPETKYNRSPASINGVIIVTDEFGHTQQLTDAEARDRFGDLHQVTSHTDTTRHTYFQTLKLYRSPEPGWARTGLMAEWKMIQSLSSPGVIWAIAISSISLGIGIAMSLTYGSILTESFGWSEASVGLVNIGIFPAAVAATLYGAVITDRVNLWLAKRNNGIHTPEHSLVNLIFPLIISLIGIVVYGTTAQSPTKYSSWGIIMGWTLYEFGFIVCLIISTHFGSEAFPKNPGPALAVVVGIKNLVSFGASFGIVPMVHKFDYITAFMILLGIFAFISLAGIPVYFFNPKWRARMT